MSHSYSMLFWVVVCFQKCILQGSQVLVLLCNDFNHYIEGIRRKHASWLCLQYGGPTMLIGTTPTPLNLCFFAVFFMNIHETCSIHYLNFFQSLNFLLIGCAHSKMNHTQFLCSFQKEKNLNWKLKWHATIVQNLWFNYVFDSNTIYFYNKI